MNSRGPLENEWRAYSWPPALLAFFAAVARLVDLKVKAPESRSFSMRISCTKSTQQLCAERSNLILLIPSPAGSLPEAETL